MSGVLEPIHDGRADYHQPSSVLERLVEEAVHTTLRTANGPDAVKPQPWFGPEDPQPVPDPTDYLDGITVALHVAAGAHRLVVRYVRNARARGTSWHDLAAVLLSPHEPAQDGLSPAERAFRRYEQLRNPHRDKPFLPLVWVCWSCTSQVYDDGPDNGNPADCEHGHAPGCARHQAAIEAWRRESDHHN